MGNTAPTPAPPPAPAPTPYPTPLPTPLPTEPLPTPLSTPLPTPAPTYSAVCASGDQSGYRGTMASTGMPCQKWTDQRPHVHHLTPGNYPNVGLGDHNYCRNPDFSGSRAWCYTSDPSTRWAYCGIPDCPAADCADGDQSGYRGARDYVPGLTCSNWETLAANHHNHPNQRPNAGLGDHNYCRNPDGGSRAWCYTGSLDDPTTSWAYCNVPACPASGSSSNSRGASIEIIIPVVVAAVLLVAAALYLVRKRRVATATPDEIPQIGAEAAVEAS